MTSDTPLASNALPKFVSQPDSSIYLSNNYIVLDFETTNHDHGSALEPRNSLVLAGWRLGKDHPGWDGRRTYAAWGSEYEHGQLLQLISSAAFLVAHNLKFEYQWLARCGFDLRSALGFDTMLGQYVLNGNRKTGLGLDAVSSLYGLGAKASFVAALIHSGVCPSDIPKEALEAYCKRDVELCEQVFLRERELLHRDGLLPIAYSRNLVTPVLADMETKGMCLDAQRVSDTYTERLAKHNASLEEFARITGGINARSAKQLREHIYGTLGFAEVTDYRGKEIRTGAGAASTDKATIASLEATTPEQKAFKKLALEISKDKVPVNNLKKMKAILDRGENIVYATFNQAVTQTHRLSSSGRNGGFQFHNFDRAFKRVFVARRAGCVVVEADAPQLEFRTAAALGSDMAAIADIHAGIDVHALTASILGIDRQRAKAYTFKPLYGGQSGTPKEQAYYKAFREKYPDIYKTQQRWAHEVLKTGQLVLPWGMRFYWPGTKLTRTGYIENTTSIFNYPIQSLATAEIIPITLVLVWHQTRDMGVDLINTIHDSIIAEVPELELDTYTRILYNSYTRDVQELLKRLYDLSLNTPLGVDIKTGAHWGGDTA